jgi:hypothetical protein
MGGKLNCLGYDAPVGHHRRMQLRDGLTAGFDKQERKDSVDKTGTGTQQHPAAEPGCPQQMAPVGLTDRGRVFIEEALNVHAHRLAPSVRYPVANIRPPRIRCATKLRNTGVFDNNVAWISWIGRFWNSSNRTGG